MGRRGPISLPSATKASRGTLRLCRTNADEPVYAGPAELAPPASLTGRGREEWIARIGDAVAMGVVKTPDLPTMQLYCEALNALEWLEAKITRTKSDKKLVYIDRKNKLLGQFRNLARELGFTPSSRAGVKADKPKEQGTLASFVRRIK